MYLGLCPNCKLDVRGDNVMKEQLGPFLDVRVDNLIPMKLRTTMFSYPNCHIILGISQFVGY